MIKQWVKLKSLATTALILTSFSLHASWLQPPLSHTLTAVKTPFMAKDFSLPDVDEEMVKFSAYRGKVILINFWATWCPPCVREMPSMERLYRQLKKDKFVVIAIDQMEDEDQVFAFTGQLSIEPTFTLLLDKNSKVANSYGVKGLPTTFIIDKKGRVRYRAIGGRELDHAQIKKIIKQLIAE